MYFFISDLKKQMSLQPVKILCAQRCGVSALIEQHSVCTLQVLECIGKTYSKSTKKSNRYRHSQKHNYVILSRSIQRINYTFWPLLGRHQVVLDLQSNHTTYSMFLKGGGGARSHLQWSGTGTRSRSHPPFRYTEYVVQLLCKSSTT
jgi:hypothetical protein